MTNTIKESFASTLKYPDHDDFSRRNLFIPIKNHETIKDQIIRIQSILKAARHTRALLLDSTPGKLHPDILACIIISLWRKKPVIIMAEDMWHKDEGLKGVIQKVILRLADNAIFRYAPLSTEEFPYFQSAWGINEEKLRFLPYYYSVTRDDLDSPPTDDNFIFAGGNAHRDYLPLVEAGKELPEYKFVIASHRLDGVKLPPNIVAGQVSTSEYFRLMNRSSAVVVAIRKGLVRSTGHQTYLNGMLLKKPTIITDTLGVREYTMNGKAAIIVDGSKEGYIQAVKKVMDPNNHKELEMMCECAHKLASEVFNRANHCNRLLEIIDEAIDDYYGAASRTQIEKDIT
jgi:glycosyltransferase involved in cell wall biosynthesis